MSENNENNNSENGAECETNADCAASEEVNVQNSSGESPVTPYKATVDPKRRINGADVQDLRRAEMLAEEANEKKTKKTSVKVFSIICSVLTALIVALTCYVVISMIVARAQNKPISLFGTSFAIVQTNSMEPEIMTGDMIFFRACDIDDIEVGDNIVFIAGESFGEQICGQNIVHKVVAITAEGLVTQGVNSNTNPGPDKDLVTADNFIGICTAHSTFWGKVFSFLSKYGIFILLAIFVVPFIITQIIKIFKLSKQPEITAGSEGEAGQADTNDATQPSPVENSVGNETEESQDKEQ